MHIPSGLLVDPPIPTTLPPTAARRRRQRARAAALAAVPYLLFVLAAAPRVWAPDLAPFGGVQAAELAEARRVAAALAGGAWSVPDTSASALLHALLIGLPDPIAGWVVARGLLASAVTVLLFLAVRALLGVVPAALAAALYAVSPWAWVLARDPAGGPLALVAAAALLAAVRAVQRPCARHVLVLAVLGALLVRSDALGWVFAAPLATTLLLVRPSRRTALVSLLAFGIIAGPALLPQVGFGTPARIDPIGGLDLFWRLVAGVGAGQRLPGGGAVTAPPGLLETVMLACAAGSLVLGLAVALALGRAARTYLLPPIWSGLPLAALAVLGAEPGVEFLAMLLPAAVVLLVMPLVARAGPAAVPAIDASRTVLARLRPICVAAVRRVGLVTAGLMVGLGALTLGGLLWQAEVLASGRVVHPYVTWAERVREARSDPERPGSGRPAIAPLRFWQALAEATLGAAERTDGREVVALAAADPLDDAAIVLASLLTGRLEVRPLEADVLTLPLRREALYVILPGSDVPAELSWPSARLASVPLAPTDAAVRVVSLRARPAEHWLVAASMPALGFADGTTLTGVAVRPDERPDTVLVALYWSFSAERGDDQPGDVVELIARRGGGDPSLTRAELPDLPTGRADELVAQRIRVTLPPGPSGSAATLSLAVRGTDGARLLPLRMDLGSDGELPQIAPIR